MLSLADNTFPFFFSFGMMDLFFSGLYKSRALGWMEFNMGFILYFFLTRIIWISLLLSLISNLDVLN